MKRIAIFTLLGLALTLVACGPKKTQDPAQALAQDFAQVYLAQLDFKEEDWQQMEKDLSQAGQVLSLDGDLSQEADQDLPALYDPFKEVMTQEALERMVANGDYPYFPLREKSLDQVDLVSVKRVDPDDDSYDLIFVTKKGDQETQHVLRARIDQKITYIEKPSQVFDL
ncbi:hypothetical protein [Urinicoccus timonensis]|uniref:hypothetical protein n=1 Tax=Urinicoccus timonensis TaxID=2024205 RepID=UPI000C08A475|nr:hypothetical protein [Urinicoccus timonensis]